MIYKSTDHNFKVNRDIEVGWSTKSMVIRNSGLHAWKLDMQGLLFLLSVPSLQVCDWVQRSGGWQTVLRSGMNLVQQAAVIGMCSAVMIACFIYVRKNLLSNK